MIVENIVNAVVNLILSLFSFINIPSMPEAITNGFSTFFQLLGYGGAFIGLFLPGTVVRPFFGIFLVMFSLDEGYPFVMWILRKIPMLNIN